MNASGWSCRSRDLFKRRVNEKGGVSRRQSGASNRISGLESDTPSTKPRSFYTDEGDGDLAFVYHHCPVGFGEQRQWITKASEIVLRPSCGHEKSRSIRLAWKYIILAGYGCELPKGRASRLVVHERDAAEHNYHDRPPSTFIVVISRHLERRRRRSMVLFLSILFVLSTYRCLRKLLKKLQVTQILKQTK